MTSARRFAALVAGLLLPLVANAQGANATVAPGSPTADRLPIYEIDPTWPPTLPNDWILGDIRGLFVDDRDHLWVIHMPSSLTPQEIGAAVKPPIADCCVPAPPVLELDPEGKVLRSWGGPGKDYTWFDQEHGIYIDHNGFVWTGTSNGMHVMKFTQDGKHLLTIGEPGVNKGSNDPDHLGGPANFYVEPKTNELFIADGYINKRVAVYDAATGKYLRHWGAYGKRPDDTQKYAYPVNPASPPQQYSTLHGLVGSKDGLIYVSDRRGNRIQVFRQNGEYLMERFVRPETGGSGSGFSLQFSRDAAQSLLYLIDGTNQRVWILRRKDLGIVDRFGRPGRQAGEFIRAHMIAIDSKNRMYTGEAGNGRRMQRWILKGTRPASSVKPPAQEQQAEAAKRREAEMAAPRPIAALDSVWTEELTWMEVRDAIKAGKTTGLILTGGVESNGPHLATGKHNFVLKVMGEAIARKLGHALVAPILTLEPGRPDADRVAPGSVVLSAATYRAVLTDMATSLKGMGFTNVILMGDSGGNQGAMKEVAATLDERYKSSGTRFYFIPEYYDYASVQKMLKSSGIPEQIEIGASQGSDKIHEEYGIDALMALYDPKTIRIDERTKANRATINGVSLLPMSKTLEMARKIVELRTKLTVDAINKAMSK